MKLLDIYQNAVACGELQPDPAQEAALCALERLRLDLSRPRKRGGFEGPRLRPMGFTFGAAWGVVSQC